MSSDKDRKAEVQRIIEEHGLPIRPVNWQDPEVQREFLQGVANIAQPGINAEQTYLAQSAHNAWKK
jgi:hypothetical protein